MKKHKEKLCDAICPEQLEARQMKLIVGNGFTQLGFRCTSNYNVEKYYLGCVP